MPKVLKRLCLWAVVVMFIMLIPFIAGYFTDEVQWDGFDYAFAGVVLFTPAVLYELVSERIPKRTYKIAFGMAMVGGVILMWINGAVGIIGGENNDYNMLYLFLPLIGFFGSIVSQFYARGMSRTMYALAVGQIIITVIALTASELERGTQDVIKGIILNGFFISAWIGSAMMFQQISEIENNEVQSV